MGQEPPRRITVVGDIAYAPFEFRDNSGKVAGISVDLWKLWGKKTGVEVVYRVYDWSKAIEMLRQGKADAIGGIFLRDDPTLGFSQPHFKVNISIVSSKGINRIDGLQGLKGFQVGVVRGDFMEKHLRQAAPDVPLVLAPNYDVLVKMALGGKVKVFVCDEPVAKFILAKYGALDQFHFSVKPLRAEMLRAGVRSQDKQLLELINQGFSRITQDEKMEIVLRWTGRRIVSSFQWKLFAAVFLVCLAMVAGVVAWNWMLRRNVAKATTVLQNKQEEFEAIFRAMPDMFFLVDERGRYLEFRGGSESRPLVPPEEFLGKNIDQIMPGEVAERLKVALGLAGKRREVVNLEYELDEQGQRRSYEVRIAPLGEQHFVCLARDITERKSSEQEQAMAAEVIQNSIEGIIVANADGIVLMANPACTAITGYETDELVGSQLDVLRSESDSLDLQERVLQGLAENGQWSGEYWNRRKNGEAYPEWLTLTIIRDSQDRIAYYLAIFYDITEIKQSQEQFEFQAYHDALTGLPNRALLHDRLAHAIQHARRHDLKVGVVFIDLDNFKAVNDSLGHDAGDIVLKRTAARLRGCLREQDTVARLGGDEFVMVLESVESEAAAVRVCRRALESLVLAMDLHEQTVRVRASMGIALYPDDGGDAQTLIKNADLAMYRAKEKGKNNYQLFTPALQEAVQRRMVLEGELRQALQKDQFQVHYQPQFDIGGSRIVGVEALLRWMHPQRGSLGSEAFLDLAEETGLIVPIGKWALNQACNQARQWLAINPDLFLSVRLSAIQLREKDIVHLVWDALSVSGLPPANLELGFAEDPSFTGDPEIVAALGELADRGVRLSVDNYGKGACSIENLKALPVGQIKFAPEFTAGVTEFPQGEAIVRGIIALGHTMGLIVVAKGVETNEQLSALRRMMCDQAQGDLLGRPLRASDLEELLDRPN